MRLFSEHVSERAETYLRLLAEAAIRPAYRAGSSADPPTSALDRADRVRRAADILVDAGVLDEAQAFEIMLALSTALRVRGVEGLLLGGRVRRLTGPSQQKVARQLRYGGGQPSPGHPSQPPAPSPQPRQAQPDAVQAADAPWRVIQAAAGQIRGSRLMALIVTGDRMIAPATLRFAASAGLPELAPHAFAELTASDDAGTDYMVSFTDGMWTGSTWTGTIMLRPPPPPAARLITITGRSGPILSCQLTAGPPAGPVTAAVAPTDDSPGERLLHRRAEALLGVLAGAPENPGDAAFSSSPEWRRAEVTRIIQSLSVTMPSTTGFLTPAAFAISSATVGSPGSGSVSDHPPDLPELVGTLEGAGILSPLSGVPAEVAALSQVIGLPWAAAREGDPPSPSAGSERGDVPGPSRAGGAKLPARWASVLAHYGRRHQPPLSTGTGSIGAVLPEVDGALFVVAGVRSGLTGTVLHVVGRGLRTMPRPGHDTGFSWWLRDDRGTWHLGSVEGWHVASDDTTVRLALLPPLQPGDPGTAETLTLEVTGTWQRLTTQLTVQW